MLHVISAQSAHMLRGREVDLGHLYRHWHADYVLQSQLVSRGGLHTVPERITLQVQLWRAGAGEPVYSQVVQGSATDIGMRRSAMMYRIAAPPYRPRPMMVRQSNSCATKSAAPAPAFSSVCPAMLVTMAMARMIQ